MKNLLVWTLILKLACHNPVDIRRRFRIVENFLCKSDDEGAKVQILTLQWRQADRNRYVSFVS